MPFPCTCFPKPTSSKPPFLVKKEKGCLSSLWSLNRQGWPFSHFPHIHIHIHMEAGWAKQKSTWEKFQPFNILEVVL